MAGHAEGQAGGAWRRGALVLALVVSVLGCTRSYPAEELDAGAREDGGADGGEPDAGAHDAGVDGGVDPTNLVCPSGSDESVMPSRFALVWGPDRPLAVIVRSSAARPRWIELWAPDASGAFSPFATVGDPRGDEDEVDSVRDRERWLLHQCGGLFGCGNASSRTLNGGASYEWLRQGDISPRWFWYLTDTGATLYAYLDDGSFVRSDDYGTRWADVEVDRWTLDGLTLDGLAADRSGRLIVYRSAGGRTEPRRGSIERLERDGTWSILEVDGCLPEVWDVAGDRLYVFCDPAGFDGGTHMLVDEDLSIATRASYNGSSTLFDGRLAVLEGDAVFEVQPDGTRVERARFPIERVQDVMPWDDSLVWVGMGLCPDGREGIALGVLSP